LANPSEIVWTPAPEFVEATNVQRLIRTLGFPTFDELLIASQNDPAWFWDSVVEDLGIEFFEPYTSVLDVTKGPEWAEWFVGGRVNVAHNLLDRWAERTPDHPALVWESESGKTRSVTYAQLRMMADGIASYLARAGVGEGDRVGLYMPFVPEAVAAVHACAKVGAVLLPLFSGYGPKAIAERLQDAEATVVFTADGFERRGNVVRMKEILDDALIGCPTVRHVLVFEYLGLDWTATPDRDIRWDAATAARSDFPTIPLSSEHPCLIAYTSGTTGKPKGAVHVHGGFLVKTSAEAAYQLDIKGSDIACWLTDLGWVMGPWIMIAAGSVGATLFIYDGAPDYPSPHRLWEMVERHRVSALGVSPSLIRGVNRGGRTSLEGFDLSSLRVLGTTGEPCDPDSYMWLFEEVGGRRCPIINMSGGTEAGSILSPHPVKPMKPGSLGGPALGMKAEVWVSDRVPATPGELGELVCAGPWPGMTRGIWRDRERYLDQYWRRWEGVWVHGDWASVDEDGFWFLHGRSDDVINIAGKRMGPAEVERVLLAHPSVADAAAVGIADAVKGEVLWCFVVPRDPNTAHGLSDVVAAHVSAMLGKAFRPARVIETPRLPKTRTGKVVRRALRSSVLGTDAGDLSALEDPEVLDEIKRSVSQSR
jgi:acetyl-CoA synthetase